MFGRATKCALWLILLTSGAVHTDESEVVAAARDSVDAWLQLIDGGQFSESLENASRVLRNAVSDENWNQSLRGSRSPLGAVQSRKLLGAKFAKDLPGAPPGDYVVFGFASVFQEHDNVIETVTAKKNNNGVWRVAGYFIR